MMKGRWRGWVSGAGASLLMALGASGVNAADNVQVLLDGNLKAGYQGGAILRAAVGDVVTVELYAKGILGAQGVSARLAYDTAELSYDSYTVTDLIQGGTGLIIQESGGFLEVGTGSVRGASASSEGRIATIRFRVVSAPAGSEVATVDGMATVGGQTVMAAGSSAVRIYSDIPGGIALDADTEAGFQGSTFVGGVKAGDQFTVELYATGLAGQSGYSASLAYDSKALRYDGFTNGSAIPGFTGLAIPGSGMVQVGGASVTGSATASEARLAVLRFSVLAGFPGDATITLSTSSLISPAGETVLDPTSSIRVNGIKIEKQGDADGNGTVDFNDFVQFAQTFGRSQGDTGYNAVFDFDGNGTVDFSDFVTFATNFGT